MRNNKTNIVLIQPPGWSSQNPPQGLALLKGYLAERNLQARVWDLNILLYNIRTGRFSAAWDDSNGYYLWERESYIKEMLSFYSEELLHSLYTILAMKPDVVGFSVHCSSHLSSLLLARKLRQISPETKIAFGGPQVAYYTKTWRQLLESMEIDVVVFGEGEVSLAEYIETGTNRDGAPIAGVAYIDSNGNIVDGGPRELIRSLDSLPDADFSDFNLQSYAGASVLPTYFSRGCINHCIFCTENKFYPTFRNRSGERVFREMMNLIKRHPRVDYFRFHDSVSNGNMKELEKLCDLLIENKVNIGWNLENAVIRKEMDKRMYRKLKDAGCTLIGYGLENPSKSLLKSVGKMACQTADFNKVIKDGVRSGINIGLNMMFGLPGETEDDFRMQLEILHVFRGSRRRIIINPSLNYCYFPEGSAVSSDPDRYGIDMSKGPLFWSSTDGLNTFENRLEKFERFCVLADKLGFFNMFQITRSSNRNEMLGEFYLMKGDYPKSLDFFKKSFDSEMNTVELSETILKLYALLSLEQDETYHCAVEFKKIGGERGAFFQQQVSSFSELEEFIRRTSITRSSDRLHGFVESLAEPPAEFSFSLGGFKRYIRYRLLKLVNASDSGHMVLFQLLAELENKINATQDQCRK